jgi:hypothetical protein
MLSYIILFLSLAAECNIVVDDETCSQWCLTRLGNYLAHLLVALAETSQ